jgi:hypothetical protein
VIVLGIPQTNLTYFGLTSLFLPFFPQSTSVSRTAAISKLTKISFGLETKVWKI